MSYSGNLYLPNFVRYNKISNKITQIESDHNFRRDFLEKKANKNTYIIFYGDYNYYFEKRLKILDGQIVENETPNIYASRQNINLDFEKRKILLQRKIEESLKNLSKNKKVLLIYPSPISQTNILNHIKNNRKNIGLDENYYVKDDVNYSIDIFRKYNLEILDFFNRLNIKNVKKIDLEKVFCPKDKCIFYDNKNSYIFDKIHPSYEGSKKINDLIMKEIKKIN